MAPSAKAVLDDLLKLLKKTKSKYIQSAKGVPKNISNLTNLLKARSEILGDVGVLENKAATSKILRLLRLNNIASDSLKGLKSNLSKEFNRATTKELANLAKNITIASSPAIGATAIYSSLKSREKTAADIFLNRDTGPNLSSYLVPGAVATGAGAAALAHPATNAVIQALGGKEWKRSIKGLGESIRSPFAEAASEDLASARKRLSKARRELSDLTSLKQQLNKFKKQEAIQGGFAELEDIFIREGLTANEAANLADKYGRELVKTKFDKATGEWVPAIKTNRIKDIVKKTKLNRAGWLTRIRKDIRNRISGRVEAAEAASKAKKDILRGPSAPRMVYDYMAKVWDPYKPGEGLAEKAINKIFYGQGARAGGLQVQSQAIQRGSREAQRLARSARRSVQGASAVGRSIANPTKGRIGTLARYLDKSVKGLTNLAKMPFKVPLRALKLLFTKHAGLNRPAGLRLKIAKLSFKKYAKLI